MSQPEEGKGAEKPKDFDVGDSLAKADASTIGRWMKFVNVVDALFLATAGVVSFIIDFTFNPLTVLSALYVIFFGLTLFCFECHLSRFDVMIFKNFGFMFKWQGRAFFFLFTGTLSFGIGKVGIAAGCFTAVVVIFNIYVMHVNKGFSDKIDREQQELATRVAVSNPRPAVAPTAASNPQSGSGRDDNPFTVDVGVGIGGHNMTVPVSVSAADVSNAASFEAKNVTLNSGGIGIGGAGAGGGDWDKIFDKGSGKYYYYNAKTQESRWELDGTMS